MPSGNVLFRLGIGLFLALVFFTTAAALFADMGRVTRLIAGISPGWLAAIVGAVLFNYTLRFLKWTYFLRVLGISIKTSDSLWVFFSSFTMVLSPGKLGEIIKSVLLKARYHLPMAKTAPIVMAERITDLLGLMILAAIGSSRFAFGYQTLIVLGILLATGVYLITRKEFWIWCEHRILARFSFLGRVRASFKVLEESTGNLLSVRSLLLTTPLSALSWAGEGVALFLVFRALGVEREALLGISLFAHAFSSIVGAFSFLPGGLLVTEGTLGVFFVYVGIGLDQSVSATFLIRAVTLWFAVILGTIVFLLGRRPGDLAELAHGKPVEQPTSSGAPP